MANLVSTTTPAASNPQAMTLRALKQRMEEQQAQAGALSRPHVVTSPWQGIGDIANTFFNSRRADYLQGQEKITRDTLAKMRAGWGPEGPTQAQAAEYAALDPEEGNKVADQAILNAQNTAAQNALFGHQTSEREATQGYQRGEREATQGFQRGEREATESYTDKHRPHWSVPGVIDPHSQTDAETGEVRSPYSPFNQPAPADVIQAAGAAKDFLTQLPDLEKQIAAGEATGLVDSLWGGLTGEGKSGAIRQAVDNGVEQLIQLTAKNNPVLAQQLRDEYGSRILGGAAGMRTRVQKLGAALKTARDNAQAGHEQVGTGATTPAPATAPSTSDDTIIQYNADGTIKR